MEELLVLAAFGILIVLGAGLVAAFVAIARSSTLRRDVDRLRAEVEALKRAAASTSTAVPAPPAAADLAARRAAEFVAPRTDWSSGASAPPITTAPPSAPVRADSPAPVAPEPNVSAPIVRESLPSATPKPFVPDAAPHVPTPPPAPPKKRVPIEKLIGVTVAAVLGGVTLALAGYHLYKVSAERGWVTKEVRIAMGIVAGVLAVLGSHPLKKRGYDVTANALAGGGIVVLYAAFWAAHQVFGVWPVGVSYGAMIATTAVCAWLALARNSQVVAALGLVGGFATPIALSTGSDNAIGLFGYALLVNLGFLTVAHKRRWPATALIAFLCTFVIEALWIFGRMRGETFWIAIVALGLFAALFVTFVAIQPDQERRRFAASQIGALITPFLFAIYFAVRSEDVIGYHLSPIAVLAAFVLAASGWMAVKQAQTFAPLGTAVGSVAVVLAWVLSKDLELDRAWELAACSAGLVLVLQVVLELARKKHGRVDDLLASSAAVLALGLSIAMFLAIWKSDRVGFAPWCAGSIFLALACARTAALARGAPDEKTPSFDWLGWAGAIPPAFALYAWTWNGEPRVGTWLADAPLVWALALAAALQLAWFLARDERGRQALAHGTAIALTGGLAAWMSVAARRDETPLLTATAGMLVGAALVFTARRARSSGWIATSALLLGFGFGNVILPRLQALSQGDTVLVILVLAATAALHTGLLSLAWLDTRMLARVRSASAWFWLPVLSSACEHWGGEHAKGVGALILAVLVFAGAERHARVEGAEVARDGLFTRFLTRGVGLARSPRATSVTWSRSIALCLALLAVTLTLDQNPMFVAAVLSAAGLAWLARREGYLPLAIVAAAVLVVGVLGQFFDRLAVTMPVYEYAFANWLLWLYLVPGAACVFAAKELARFEPPGMLTRVLASIAALSAVVLVFAWLHLAILDAYGSSPSFRFRSERVPTRDLTLSLAWAAYAFALLILGASRKSSGLRWTSLLLFLATVAKTFLFDLGHLTGLYRVGSLLGLAMTLLAVSLLYQRFVFKKSSEPDDGG